MSSRSPASADCLDVTAVSKRYGGIAALSDVGLVARRGEIVGLVGPNGAGKSTLLASVSGHLPHDGGTVVVNGVDVTEWPAHERARCGLRRTFQVSRVLGELSVLDNVRAGALHEQRGHVAGALCGWRRRTANRRLDEQAMDALSVVGLADRAHSRADELSYGDQRLVEVARALNGRPSVLLLDEPAAGLNTAEAFGLGEIIERTVASGATGAVVLVDHNLPLMLAVSHRLTVLHFGVVIADGEPRSVVEDPAVREAYIGA